MERCTLRELAALAGGKLVGGDTPIVGVSTDSRSVRPGELFVALRGGSFDGHAYCAAAQKRGAAACLVQQLPADCPGLPAVVVPDTLQALGRMAAGYAARFPIPRVAVTGSVGKTTAKEMLAAVLGVKYRVLKTEGNHNNEIGLPLTLLGLDSGHELAVIEMGMSAPGEIDRLAAMVRPETAVITNIGDAHIEFFGSREKILAAKCEVLDHLQPGGLLILNADDALLCGVRPPVGCTAVLCGKDENAAVRATDITATDEAVCFTLLLPDGQSAPVRVDAPGSHMIYPVLFAAAAGLRYGLTAAEIAAGAARFAPAGMRMARLVRADGALLYNDTYNANPQSMRAAIEILARTENRRRVAVLGDMLELGEAGPRLHREIGALLGPAGVDTLITVGPLGAEIAGAADGVKNVCVCADPAEAEKALQKAVDGGCAVLLKASRGMHFERLTAFLMQS